MPATATILQTCLLLWASITPWGSSTPLKKVNECPGYKASNVQHTNNGTTADLTLAGPACDIHGKDLKDLKFLVEYQTESRVHVVIYDKDEQVYQVPDFVVPRPGGSVSAEKSQLEVSLKEDPFAFTVIRKSNKEVLFTTEGSDIVFETQYLRLRTSLPDNPALYGLGEHTDPLKLPTQNYNRTLWAKDAGAVPQNSNLYGTHPVYYEHRAESNNAHGVALLNSNGMDIKINNQDGQYLEYNTLGGVFDFYFLAGPSPFDVAREYSEVSQKAVMMPYWGLGFHQCRFGYASAEEVAEVVANFSKANIPLETMWTDIDYMDEYKVFTLGKKFPVDKMRNLVSDLHAKNQHYIMMVDPAVGASNYSSFNRGEDEDIFLKFNNGTIYRGVVWPGPAAFPDWFHEKTQGYWDNEFSIFFNPEKGVDIDGLWIDMNEPSNFCIFPCDHPETDPTSWPTTTTAPPTQTPIFAKSQQKILQDGDKKKGLPGRNLLEPSYQIDNDYPDPVISQKTARTDLIHQGGWAEYDTHNLYGTMMSKTSASSMLHRRPNKRPLVITRSTFMGAGSYVGHWLGDNVSDWSQYVISIRHLLQFVSFFQVPMVGADVCGFLGTTTEHLCARWTTLGAFYPFYRNHNVAGRPSQEPYRWESVANAARKAIDLRYRLLDYIYTAMHQQSVDGTPMLAPLWMHYPADPETHGIDKQFFYGPSLLISPVTEKEKTSVTFYLPDDIFYDLFTLKAVDGKRNITYDNVGFADMPPAHVKGGSIIPARINGANTTTALREQDFELLIAPNKDGKARGTLYLDDGESVEQTKTSEIEFVFDGEKLRMEGTFEYDAKVGILSVTVMGTDEVKKYKLNEGLDQAWERRLKELQSAQ
ncbi:alpha/beta-glucosidase agdC [Lojkania enalia]|uniref:Probable alpha/beta-glucosidase agdC n=1 Tax=Lojkania enalia TaxID=147567 RepID=A0A9P4NB09_9PLEO|nr:alpha/beta-glucosidase agdC [Didymosphaeria enalia]